MVAKFDMKRVPASLKDIPDEWIYKWYAKEHGREIHQPFDRRTIKIRSFVNRDTVPSLCIFYNERKKAYCWKDHSSEQSGDAIAFVQNLLHKTYQVTVDTILKDWEVFLSLGGVRDQYDHINAEIQPSSMVYEAKIRPWLQRDLDFWYQWHIKSKTVLKYNISPLDSYTMYKGAEPILHFGNVKNVFGYYCEEYGLYQIYNPENRECKYLNSKHDYLVGRDQLEFKHKTCIIVSGLKDLMALDSVDLNIELVAGKSENTLISAHHINLLKSKYDHIFTMFDNDEAGMKAMIRYKKIYDIDYIRVTLEQDLALNNRMRNLEFLKAHYAFLINQKINNGATSIGI